MSLFRVEGATPDEKYESTEHCLAAKLAAVRATAVEAQTTVDESAAQYQTLRKLAADAKTSVDACRAQLGLRRPVEIDGLADRAEAEPAGARVLEHWEAQVEAEEALRLLAELRPHAR